MLAVLLIGVGWLGSLYSQEAPLAPQVETARKKAVEQHVQQKKLATEMALSRKEIRELKQALVPIMAMQKEFQTELAEINKKLVEEQKQSAAAKKDLDAKLKIQAEAQKQLDAAKLASEQAKKEFTAKEGLVKATQTSIAAVQQKIEGAKTELTKQMAAIKSKEAAISKTSTALQQIAKLEAEQWKHVREIATQDKSWVSFSEEIAPVLQKRCLACHNESKPRGQLKFDSYSVLHQGGESGSLFDFESPEFSTLIAMIEDGSMPKDDDPLSPEQITSFKRWVKLGAQFDASFAPETPLIEVMPRPIYPSPPQNYPAPIPVEAVAIHADGKRVVSSGYHELLVWSLETGELLRRIPGFPERIYSLSFHGDSSLLAVGSGTPGEIGEVKVIDLDTSKVVANLHIAASIVTDLTFSADLKQLAAAGVDGQVHIFETENWQKVRSIHAHSDWITDLDFSPDGSKLVSSSRDKTAKVFELSTGENQITFNGHGNVVSAVRFLASGKEIASCGDDRKLRVWSVSDAKEVRNVSGFAGPVTAIKLLKDGKLASTSTDKKLRFHTANDSKVEKTWTGPTGPLLSLDSAAAQHVTGSVNGELHLWSTTDDKPIRTWLAKPEEVLSSASEEKTPEK